MDPVLVRAVRTLLAATLVALAAAGDAARACSFCRCGDPTFNALGIQVFTAGRWRVALDWDRAEKRSAADRDAAASTPAHRSGTLQGSPVVRSLASLPSDNEVEQRLTASASYSFGERVTLLARVPFSRRTLTTSGGGLHETTHASDLSDPEIHAVVQVWSSRPTGDMSRRTWLSVTGGVKTPWGRNTVAEHGVRLDEHVQPGTGSTDVMLGLSSLHVFGMRSSVFGSTQYRRTGSNDFGYRYGNAVLANVGYEHRLGSRFDGAFELNYRDAQRDRVDDGGARDANSGGGVLYATPRLLVELGENFVARLAVQVPVAQRLNGDQKERAVVNVGMTYLF